MCKMMESKYTSDNIKKCLKKWEGYGLKNSPALQSIPSRLKDSSANTSVALYKRYPLIDLLSFPNHYYISVDGIEWHPGDLGTDQIFMQGERNNKGRVMHAYEMCFHCTYHTFLEWFSKDKKFNFFTNNCQNILGNIFETALLLSYHVSLLLFVVFGKIIFFIISIALFATVAVHQSSVTALKELQYSACPHIQNIY